MFADILTLVASGVGLTYLMDRIPQSSYGSNVGLTLTCAVVFFLLGTNAGLYKSDTILDRRLVFRRAFFTVGTTFVALVVSAFALKQSQNYSRAWFFTWAVSETILVLGIRLVFGALLASRLRRGDYLHRAAVLFTEHARLAVPAPRSGTFVVASLPVLAPDAIDDQIEAAKRLGVDLITVRCGWDEFPRLVERATAHKTQAVDVAVEVTTPASASGFIALRSEEGRFIVDLARRPIHGWNAELKRFEDVVVAGLALALLWPLMLAVAVAIKLESRGPVLFRQPRLGFNNVPFEVWKFRSMYAEVGDIGATHQTVRGDPRVTRVGRFIRRTSLDELPQLFNVLRGHMSVVGPRPHALHTSAAGKNFQDLVDSYAARHRVLPGMTGWAQVNGLRGAVELPNKIEQRVQHDLFYIDNWSIWLDIRTMLMTLRVLINDRNAY